MGYLNDTGLQHLSGKIKKGINDVGAKVPSVIGLHEIETMQVPDINVFRAGLTKSIETGRTGTATTKTVPVTFVSNDQLSYYTGITNDYPAIHSSTSYTHDFIVPYKDLIDFTEDWGVEEPSVTDWSGMVSAVSLSSLRVKGYVHAYFDNGKDDTYSSGDYDVDGIRLYEIKSFTCVSEGLKVSLVGRDYSIYAHTRYLDNFSLSAKFTTTLSITLNNKTVPVKGVITPTSYAELLAMQSLDAAVCELYETTQAQDATIAEQDAAICELYEMITPSEEVDNG